MAITYDADPTGFSGAVPSGLPFSISWEHESAAVSNPSPGLSVWVVMFRDGTDILSDSTRSCTCDDVAMESKGVVALANNSLVFENFVLVGQGTGKRPVKFSYGNARGVKPAVVRATSVSYKSVLGFGSLQKNQGRSASGSLAATSASGEMLSVCNVVRGANIGTTSGVDRFNKNNVTPRVAVTDEVGAATVNITMVHNTSDWGIGAVRLLESSDTEPPPPPPDPPTLPAVASNPLGGVMLSLPGTYQPSPDITVYPISTTAPAYSSPTTFDWSTHAAKFRYGGTLVLSDNNGYQTGVNNVSGQSTNTNPLTAGLTSFETEFWGNLGSRDLTIKFRNFASSDYLILVDDKPLFTQWQNFPSSSGYKYQRMVFKDDLPHRVRILHGANGFCGVIVPGGGDIQPAGARFRIAITGDSYVQGAGAASEPGMVMAAGMCGYLSLLMGAEVWNFGQGTTGYIQEGTGGNRSRFGSTARLATLNARSYGAIIVFGGGNDTNETPSNLVNNYAKPMWQAIKTAHPTTPLIVVGIQSPDLFAAADMIALNSALRTAALADSNVDLWIDMRNPQYWVDETTEDLFITPEFPASIHPGKAGSLNLALRIMHAIAMAQLQS